MALIVKRKAYKRKSYRRKDGTLVQSSRVPASSFKIKDRGKRGRTPKGEQWYDPQVKTGWEKGMNIEERRHKVLRAHGGDLLSSGRAMQSLSNVTTDKMTKARAKADASYFFRENRRTK